MSLENPCKGMGIPGARGWPCSAGHTANCNALSLTSSTTTSSSLPSFCLPPPLRQHLLLCRVVAGGAGADGWRRWGSAGTGSSSWAIWSISGRLRESFTNLDYKIRAVREELLQVHMYLLLALVQDSALIPSRSRFYSVFVLFQLSYNSDQLMAEFVPLFLWVPWAQNLPVSIKQNWSSYCLLSIKMALMKTIRSAMIWGEKKALSQLLHCVRWEKLSAVVGDAS